MTYVDNSCIILIASARFFSRVISLTAMKFYNYFASWTCSKAICPPKVFGCRQL